jgi:hypothetical protein
MTQIADLMRIRKEDDQQGIANASRPQPTPNFVVFESG